MPYHIFEINAFRQSTLLDTVADYREAKQIVRDIRRSGKLVAGTTVRMMFAADQLEAERLLNERREPRPMGEHD